MERIDKKRLSRELKKVGADEAIRNIMLINAETHNEVAGLFEETKKVPYLYVVISLRNQIVKTILSLARLNKVNDGGVEEFVSKLKGGKEVR